MFYTIFILVSAIFCHKALSLMTGTCANLGIVAIYAGFIANGKEVRTAFLYGVYGLTTLGVIIEGIAHYLYEKSGSLDGSMTQNKLVATNDVTAAIKTLF